MFQVIRLLLLFLPLSLTAQQQPLQYTRLTAENGLSNNSVQCILQDNSGIVWIGTSAGLNRYDGASFITYSVLSSPALSNNAVTTLLQDEKGFIWIGTENGLNILQPATNTIQQYIHNDAAPASLPAGPVRVIRKMTDGSIWVLSDKWMVKFNDQHQFSMVSIDSALVQNEMVFTAVALHQPGEVWISYLDKPTTLARLTTINGRDHIQGKLVQAPDYFKIFANSIAYTWGISNQGITRFNNTTHHFENWLGNPYAGKSPNLHVHACYCLDADENIWQGNERGGLVKYDTHVNKVTDYSWLLAANSATSAYCVYKDNSNNIWIGTDNGIIKISNRTSLFQNIAFAQGNSALKNIRCRRIIADKYNTLYAATENYGLLKMKRTRQEKDTTMALSTFGNTPISDLPWLGNQLSIKLTGRYDIGYMYDMWYDGNNTIWLAGYGISCYDINTDSLHIFLAAGDEQARQESITQFAIVHDGRRFWTSGQSNLYVFDPQTQQLQPFRDNKGNMPFHHLPCWSLAKKDNYIWAGTSKGLYKVNSETHEVTKLTIHPVLEFGINDINIDVNNNCWISTAGGGVIQYNEQTGLVKQYTSKDGLSNNTVCGLLPDQEGNIWISTYAGLSYFDRQANRFTNFYTKDGLNTDEFNRKAFTKLTDGRMIFGGLNGYIIFNPADAFKRDKPVNIILTRFTKTTGNGEAEEQIFNLPSFREVTIEPDDKFFAFHFTLSDMYDPAGNRYMYRLQGQDNAWHAIGNQNFVSFNGLPAGKYTLHIKGKPAKGATSFNEIMVNIRVKQVFYKTTWFILLLLAAAIAIAYAVVRYRINQVKKIQDLRTRIASDLHDEVGSSLVHITMLTEMVKRSDKKELIDEQLTSISSISRGAVSTMKDMIWSIDSRYDTMAGMISHMQDHIHNVLAPADREFTFNQQGLNEHKKLSVLFRQNVYLIFKEAINNIVKHSNATHVQIDLVKEHGIFSMRIADNGKGIDKGKHSSGQGLNNMHMRAKRLNATLDITSVHGVTILLKVPL
jgi:signal transduction histidine kinase/ligand-binding sensor domain-containing protein